MYRREIWLVDMDPTIGAEIQKTRPAIIVSDDAIGILPLKIVVPVTDWKGKHADWIVQIVPDTSNGLSKHSGADTFQIRSLSERRFRKRIGELSESDMRRVTQALAKVLGMQMEKVEDFQDEYET